jgi:aminopeptidase N
VHAMSASLESAFTPSERVRLLSDEWASVAIGRQTIADYMALADGLRGENDTAVIDMLTVRLGYIGQYLVNDSDRDSYEQWVRGLLTPLADTVGWQPTAGEDGDRKALRAQVLLTLGATGRDKEVLERAGKLAHDALDKSGSMDLALAGTTLQLAAMNGDAAFYDQVLDRLKKASSPEELGQLRAVLENFDDPKLLNRTLQLSMTPEVRSQDMITVITSVMFNPAGAQLAWNFLREHWAEIGKKLGGYNGSGRLVAATGSFCDPDLRAQVTEFFSAHPIPDAERTLQQSLETIRYCVDLKSQQSAPLAAWLEHHSSSTGE